MKLPTAMVCVLAALSFLVALFSRPSAPEVFGSSPAPEVQPERAPKLPPRAAPLAARRPAAEAIERPKSFSIEEQRWLRTGAVLFSGGKPGEEVWDGAPELRSLVVRALREHPADR